MIETRITSSRTTLGVLERINAARGPREYLKALEAIDQEVDELVDLSRAHMRAIAATRILTIDDSDLQRTIKTSPTAGKKAIIKPADTTKLAKQYRVTVELAKKLKDLDLIEAEIEMKFGKGDTTGLKMESAVKKSIAFLQQIRKRIYVQLEEAYSFMQKLASGRVPDSFTKMSDALGRILSKALAYKKVTPYLYVYPNEGSLAVTQYFALEDMEDDDGRFFPRYFVVLTGVLAEGTMSYFMTTLTDFDPPGTFPLGKDVTDAKTMRQSLAFLLDLDKVANSLARLPLSTLLADGLVKEQFTVKDMVQSLTVDDDELLFTLRRGCAQEDASSAAQQLNIELQGMMRRTKFKVRMKVTRKGTQFTVGFTIVRPSDIPVTVADLQFLKGRFGVSDQTIQVIVDTINRSN